MIPEELERSLLDASRTSRLLSALRTRSIRSDFPSVSSENDPSVIDWADALLLCSILGRSEHEEAQDLALRIAQGCLSATEADVAFHSAAAVMLERMGNRPAVTLAESRGLVINEAWTEVPVSLQLDVIHRRLELSIPLSDGSTVAANPFQREFWSAVGSARWVSVSAPTSAGKSFIVKRWLAERLSTTARLRAVYLVPTRALIEEVSTDLRSEFKDLAKVFTLPWDREIGTADREVFVHTQERLHLLQQAVPDFAPEVIFVDEAQKFGDDTRGVLLQQVVDECVRRSPGGQVLFASPLSENPAILLETAPETEPLPLAIESESVTVNQNLLWADQVPYKPRQWTLTSVADTVTEEIGHFELPARPSPDSKRLPFVALALGRDEPGNVVYVNGAASAEATANQIYEGLGDAADLRHVSEIVDLEELIRKTVHPRYALATVITRGVAFHYGNMPLLLRGEIERLFRTGVLRYLVCTSTLLEGVNLPCRNLFARNPKKGNGNPMSPADFWNLAGRAGRWGKEFQGNIVCVDANKPAVWADPPRRRSRWPLTRSTGEALRSPGELSQYIDAGFSADAARENPLLEAMFSYLATRRLGGQDLDGLPGLQAGAASTLRDQVDRALEAVDLPPALLTRHAGIGPLAMQQMLESFRAQAKADHLLLAPPESWDATDTYTRALARCNADLGAPFGVPKRQFMLALLITNWMRGHPLSRIINERVEYLKSRGTQVNLPAEIRAVMTDIEKVARFEAPKFLACYDDILRFHFEVIGQAGAADAFPDITMMLELGVSRNTEVALISLGLSRTSAVALAALMVDDDLSAEDCLAWLRERDFEELDLPALVRQEIRLTVADSA